MGIGERFLAFIPTYNCAPQIGRVVAQFDGPVRQVVDHLLVVDNRSTDGTLAAAKLALADAPGLSATLVQNNENYGLGGSHKVAFDYAHRHGFDYLVVLHGDDQGAVHDLLSTIEAGAHRKADALLGARFMPGSQLQGYSSLRIFGNIVFNLVFSIVLGKRIYDLGSGLNLFRTSSFEDGFFLSYGDDLTFNYSLILGMARKKFKLHFFPISWREDDQISNVKLVRQTLKMLRILWTFVLDRDAFVCGRDGWLGTHTYRSKVLLECPGATTSASANE